MIKYIIEKKQCCEAFNKNFPQCYVAILYIQDYVYVVLSVLHENLNLDSSKTIPFWIL